MSTNRMNNTTRTLAAAFGLATLALAAGCADNDPQTGDQFPIDEHACVHFDDGTPITATESDTDAPDISAAHTGFAVTLPNGATPGGFVSFAASEVAEYGFFVSDGVTLEVYDVNGHAVALDEKERGSGTCGISDVFVFDLLVGTYNVYIEPEAGVDSVSVAIEVVDHEDHDHEGEDLAHDD